MNYSLFERLRIYFGAVTNCLLWLAVGLITGAIVAMISLGAGYLIIFLAVVFSFFRMHFIIDRRLNEGGNYYALLIVTFVSTALVVFKVGVNEYGIDTHFDVYRPDEFMRMIRYIGFAIWTSMLLWEGCATLMKSRNKSVIRL
jgi:hypothetical protein